MAPQDQTRKAAAEKAVSGDAGESESLDISARLLAWYDAHHRDLPWRVIPGALARGTRPDPYRVWLSEVMLQQTTVEAVKAYFRSFL
ncbi:MAG: A/G-specific adenine glycosylase, partial [Mesorhizobium sp.]